MQKAALMGCLVSRTSETLKYNLGNPVGGTDLLIQCLLDAKTQHSGLLYLTQSSNSRVFGQNDTELNNLRNIYVHIAK